MSADNKNEGLWQLINKEICTSQNKNNNIKIGSKITTDPPQTAEKFNVFFTYTIRGLKQRIIL